MPAGPAAQPAAGTPREIRAALLPEEVGQFDSAWRAALARAAESLDLGEVYDVLRHWRRIARLTQADPDAHRRMLAKAGRALAGGPEPTRTLDEMRGLVRRRLGT
jgi:hypothetical protein